MAESALPGDDAQVFDRISAVLRDRDAGRVLDLAHYQARWPEHAALLAREWATLEPAEQGAPADDSAAQQVGPWRLVRELGRGGQGSVWLAEDTRIARRAALKLLPESFAAFSQDRRMRLRREAEALARLEHPGLCPILEAEVEGERPYLAMRLIEGETLAARIARTRAEPAHRDELLGLAPGSRAELERCLVFFEAAARALHVAHEAGIVHRDVKPGNVMVTPTGHAVLVDFGQAREESGEAEALTLSGEVFGTPAYMSPEQVRGQARAVDRRTDVWSLGATLFEALTLQRPFEGASVSELLMAIDSGPLPDLRALGRSLPRDLRVVLATALERDRSRRYATALALAEDLAHLRLHEPIRARPAGPLLRLRRWARRNPGVASGLAAVLISLTMGWAWTLHLLAREQRANEFALGSHLAKRAQALIGEDPAAALALGIEAVEKAPNYESRAALLAALDACNLQSALQGSPGRRFHDLDIDATGTRAAGALDDGAVRIYALADGALLQAFALDDLPLRAVRFTDGGRRCVAVGEAGRIHLLSLEGQPAVHLDGPGGALVDLESSPDGTRLALCSTGAAPRVIDALDGHTLVTCELPEQDYNALAWSPGGERLLAFGRALRGGDEPRASSAALIDPASGALIAELTGASAAVTFAAFDATGARVALVALDGSALLFDAHNGQRLPGPERHVGALFATAFSPDGRWLAWGGEGAQPLGLWDLTAAQPRALQTGSDARVTHLAFAPDGKHLACATDDTSTRLYQVDDGRLTARFSGFVQPLENLWTPDGRNLLTLGKGNTVSTWIADGRDDVYALEGHSAAVLDADFSPDGARALTASLDGTARLWCTARPAAGERAGHSLAVLRSGSGPVRGARFSADPRFAWTWGDDGQVWRWDARDGSARGAAGPLDARVLDFDAAPSGPWAALVTAAGTALRLDASDASWRVIDDTRANTCVRFADDGRHLAVGRADGGLRLFDAELQRVFDVPAEAGGLPIVEIAFAPSARELCSVDTKGRVRFVHDDGSPARPALISFAPLALDWSRDGQRLLVVGSRGRGAFRLQDLASDTQERLEAFHAGDLTGGEFSPDGALVLSSSMDGTVYVRNSADGVPVALLTGHHAAVLRARFSRDDGPLRVITASADGTARICPVDPLPAARARKPRGLHEWEYYREQRLALPLRYER